jgi:hypothetical protein
MSGGGCGLNLRFTLLSRAIWATSPSRWPLGPCNKRLNCALLDLHSAVGTCTQSDALAAVRG